MRLLTKELIRQLPKLYATEEQPLNEKLAIVKLFDPLSQWTWYIIEFDGEDRCFGLVCGHDQEFGYFSLAELSSIGKDQGRLPIERDRYFESTPTSKLLTRE